ncbi:MAG TPA: putative porin [Thermoanaerobaculia bacterium]|nr:putative porin [Thermoanaerobaculia bacterium]
MKKPGRLSALAMEMLRLMLIPAALIADERPRWTITGDLRLRAESDWSSTAPDGSERADRNRLRARARLAMDWRVSNLLTATGRLRTGHPQSQQSPHITLVPRSGETRPGLLIDRLFIGAEWRRADWCVGRCGHPFWLQNELLFDDDLFWDGITVILDSDRGTLRAMTAFVPDGDANLDLTDRGVILGAQYVTNLRGMTVGIGFNRIEDPSGAANPVLLDEDSSIWSLSARHAFQLGAGPLTLGLDLMHNSDSPSPEHSLADEREGIVVSATLGKPNAPGDWQVGMYWARIEKFAVVPYLAQDDWVRWGSATQTRSSNFEGTELRAVRRISTDLDFVFRLYLVKGIEPESPVSAKEDGNRARLDLNWKF